jgi:hypothetical protein
MQQYLKSFDLIFDVEEKEERVSWFKKLFKSCSRKKRPTTIARENIIKMFKVVKTGESTRGFRIQNPSLEYELLQAQRQCESIQAYNLMSDFERLVDLLTSFVEEPERKPCYEVEVTIEVPRPKKLRKVTTYDKITILERWVKIGYKMYRRQFDCFTGEEYIIVDGDVYDIKCDRYGREYLA